MPYDIQPYSSRSKKPKTKDHSSSRSKKPKTKDHSSSKRATKKQKIPLLKVSEKQQIESKSTFEGKESKQAKQPAQKAKQPAQKAKQPAQKAKTLTSRKPSKYAIERARKQKMFDEGALWYYVLSKKTGAVSREIRKTSTLIHRVYQKLHSIPYISRWSAQTYLLAKIYVEHFVTEVVTRAFKDQAEGTDTLSSEKLTSTANTFFSSSHDGRSDQNLLTAEDISRLHLGCVASIYACMQRKRAHLIVHTETRMHAYRHE